MVTNSDYRRAVELIHNHRQFDFIAPDKRGIDRKGEFLLPEQMDTWESG
jgi:hypothetical protein